MHTTPNRARKKIPALAAMALMTALTGSILPAPTAAAAAAPATQTSPTATFNKLAAAGNVSGMWTFIQSRVGLSSPASLEVWLRRLEAVQEKRRDALEEEMATEQVQNALMQADLYDNEGRWTRTARTGVPKADALLDEITSQGYVLDSAEGYFFPKLDYEKYLKYAKEVTPRYARYLAIRADDTRSELTYDAGLVVTWDELLERAERQSAYLVQYPKSPETPVVAEMYKQTLFITLYGVDNTPLFDYETHVMDYYARKAYQRHAALKSDTPFSNTLRSYMKILEKSGFKLSKSAEAFRDARNPWVIE